MKIQKFNPFLNALQFNLVPSGKIYVKCRYDNSRLYIDLPEKDIYSKEAYLTAFDKKKCCCVAVQKLAWENETTCSIQFAQHFLNALESVDYSRLCIAMYKDSEFVYSFLNSPDLDEDNYQIYYSYIGTVQQRQDENDLRRCILYFSKAGALSIKFLNHKSEFNRYIQAILEDVYYDAGKLYFRINCASNVNQQFLMRTKYGEKKYFLEMDTEDADSYNRKTITVFCNTESIEICRFELKSIIFDEEMPVFGDYNKRIEVGHNNSQKLYITVQSDNKSIVHLSLQRRFKIAVIISRCGSKRHINETVESIFSQTMNFNEDIQILFADSRKKNESNYHMWVKEYPNNIGVCDNLREAILQSDATYISVIEAGDIFSEKTFVLTGDWFERKIECIDVSRVELMFPPTAL